MRRPQLGGGADPAGTDNKEDLGESEIAQAERLLKRNTAVFDIALGAI
jgi:hypothetical protein